MIAAQAPRNRKNAGIVSSKKRNKCPAGTDVWWVRMRCMVEAGESNPWVKYLIILPFPCGAIPIYPKKEVGFATAAGRNECSQDR